MGKHSISRRRCESGHCIGRRRNAIKCWPSQFIRRSWRPVCSVFRRPVIGLLATEDLPDTVRADLADIQHDLFDLGGELSIPGYSMIADKQVGRLDARLAHYNADLPRLAEFILPGGSRAAAVAHVCRTVCRRAERAVVALGKLESINPGPRQYLNRLSDLMFVLARVLNRHAGGTDVQWQQRKNQ